MDGIIKVPEKSENPDNAIFAEKLFDPDKPLPFEAKDNRELYDAVNELTAFVFRNIPHFVRKTPTTIEYVIDRVGRYDSRTGLPQIEKDSFLLISEDLFQGEEFITSYSISELDKKSGLTKYFASMIVDKNNSFSVKSGSNRGWDFEAKEIALTLMATKELLQEQH